MASSDLSPAAAGEETRPCPRSDKLALAAAACFAVLSVAYRVVPLWSSRNYPPTWTWDIDTILIRGGLRKAPAFHDTLSWWTGTWVGQVPFYRPLTSYLYWTEWKIFGDREWLYALPDFAAHIVATILFGALIFRLARNWGVSCPAFAAMVAAWGFSGWMLEYRGSVTTSVFAQWKNQPDAFAAVCCFASLIYYVKAQEKNRQTALPAALWYLAGCGFKEIAVPLPVICACLEGSRLIRNTDRSAGRRLAWMLAAALAFLFVRTLALRSIGYTYGRNADWLRRTIQELLGPFSAPIVTGEWLGFAVGLWIFAVIVLCIWRLRKLERSRSNADVGLEAARRKAVAVAFIAVVLGMSALGTAYMEMAGGSDRSDALTPLGGVIGFLRCLQPVVEGEILATITLLTAIAIVRKQHVWVLVTAFVWTLAFLIPLMLSPIPIHRYYLSQAGYYLLYGFTAGIAFDWLLSHIPHPDKLAWIGQRLKRTHLVRLKQRS